MQSILSRPTLPTRVATPSVAARLAATLLLSALSLPWIAQAQTANTAPGVAAHQGASVRTSSTSTATVLVDAGPDATVSQGSVVTLSGSALTTTRNGTRTVRLLWQQTAGPAVVISGVDTAKPIFTMPYATTRTVLTFLLTATVGTVSASDTVTVTAERDSPWGVAPSHALSFSPESWLPSMAAAGVQSVRGFYRTETVDKLPPILAAGMSGVGFLKWSPAGGPLTVPANDLAGWKRYVTDQVSRYKGRVTHWEVWNEPPNFTADTSPVSYGRVVAAAYEAAKAVDSTVQIGLAAKSNHVKFLAEAIAAGAANKFDFITLHPYEVAGFLPQGWEGAFMAITPRVRAMLADKNPARAHVPVWFTEIGVSAAAPAQGGLGPDVQGDTLVKIYTLALAQGVARVYWFDPRDSEGRTKGLTTGNGAVRPAWHALKALSTHLGARPQYAGWLQPELQYHGIVFNGPQGVVMAAWAPAEQTRTLTLASDVTVVNTRTGTTSTGRNVVLSSSPVLLVAPTGSAQATQWKTAAAVNAGQAFPWSGNFSQAQSVSLTAGQAPQGLFLANPPAVRVVNGISEFNFEGRGGPAFAVDPNFLSYAPAGVRITVTVRRNSTAGAGFNLKYEADVPILAADGNGLLNSAFGWHTVAGGTYYEKSWTVTNTRFVGMYGFNFRLDSDGPTYSNFSIQKIVVTKLQ